MGGIEVNLNEDKINKLSRTICILYIILSILLSISFGTLIGITHNNFYIGLSIAMAVAAVCIFGFILLMVVFYSEK